MVPESGTEGRLRGFPPGERGSAIGSNHNDRLRVTYELTGEENPEAKAREIAIEQTAELPPDCFSGEIDRRVVGRLEGMEPLGPGRHRATISYAAELFAGELPQLLVVLLGNLSMYRGIRIVDVEWPPSLLEALPGPALGISGLRARLLDTDRRPLFCAALKPVGLSTAELAALCLDLARGGADLIKDDQGLADQATAPFEQRVRACAAAVARAADETGRESLYLPHLTGPVESLKPRLALLEELEVPGALICPFVTGLDSLRALAESSGLLLLAHPAASGWYWQGDPSVAPEVLLGDLLRIAGADGAIFPNPGARFPFSEEEALALVDRLRRPLEGIRPAFPVPGGGIQVETLEHWTGRYGPDTVFLVGGSLFQQGDPEEATRRLMERLTALREARSSDREDPSPR